MNELKKHLILGLIVFLALILRTAYLNISPPGFNADEAALGYNAYSLLKTGKDEWGESFPLVFKSFSDYKPGIYVYLTIPFVATLGLNELAVRLPSILLGTLSVLFIYLLSLHFFKKKTIALATAFLLAISPWHIHYSRGAWETNIATFFILMGIYYLLKGLGNTKFLFISGISFVLSMYSYQSTRVVVPLLLVLLIPFYYKKLFTQKTLYPIAIASVLLVPLFFIVFSSRGLARFQGVSIFTDIGPSIRLAQYRGEHENPNDLSAKIFHNKLTLYGLNFLEHYSDHFTSSFWFLSGDPLGRNRIPEMGQMHLFEIVTIFFGLYLLLKNRHTDTKIIFLWLAVAPVAASLTYQTPHALRAHNMVIPLILISGLGLGTLIEKIKLSRRVVVMPSLLIVSILTSFFFIKFLHQYFIHLPKQLSLEWEYGFSQVVPYVFSQKDKYQKVVITDKYDQAYILYLFYSQYDPAKYQKSAKPSGVDKFGFSTITSFDNFEFRPIGKEEVHQSKGTLFVGTPDEIPTDVTPDKEVLFPDGRGGFKIKGT